VAAQDRRCPNCGALVSADAAWCGQCYASLDGSATQPAQAEPNQVAQGRAEQGRATASVGSGSTRDDVVTAPKAEPVWPCPVCGTRNPIEADLCSTCGTSFAQVMREDPERLDVIPKEALTRSLLFPGLGHRMVGRSADGLARAVLFGVTFGMALLLGFTGVRTAIAFASFALFLLAAIAIYAFSAYEAYRLAEGSRRLISSRQLLWAFAAVICASVALIAIAVVSGSRR
jgi:hypothetical protein